MNAFQNLVVPTYARVIILNILHPKLPKLPILLMPTCNKFGNAFVRRQWSEIFEICREELKGLVIVIGNASDGDSRRRKCQLDDLTCIEKDRSRFRPISACLGFHLCVRVTASPDTDGTFIISNLGDQDGIHNHKKLINHLDHSSRTLKVGPRMIHMNHLMFLIQEKSVSEHGLTKSHVIRKDRQNWKICQEMCFKRFLSFLESMGPSVLGTLKFLQIVHYYADIFISVILSLADRIRNASIVITFFGIWKTFIERSPKLKKKQNFLSPQTYHDVLISCHAAVTVICYMRETSPNLACYLGEMGSECCEKFFSRHGQWSGNHHTFDIGTVNKQATC